MWSNIVFLVVPYGSREYEGLVALREEILRKPLGLSFTRDELILEKDHIHIGGFLGDKIVATAVLVREGNKLKMQRVAIQTSLQSQGIGSKLMLFCEEFARKQGYTSIYCHARGTAVSFYLKNGWSLVGEPFDEDGIPHHKMVKVLV